MYDFLLSKCPDTNTLRPKYVDSSCKQYICNGNIQIFWSTKLFINTWYSSPIKLVLEYYNTQEICIKAVDTCPFIFNSVPDRYNTKEMFDKAVSKNPFMLKYFLDRCKSQ